MRVKPLLLLLTVVPALAVLLVWGSAFGPDMVEVNPGRQGPSVGEIAQDAPVASPPVAPSAQPWPQVPADEGPTAPWVEPLFTGLAVAMMLLLVAALVRWWLRREPPPPPDPAPVHVPGTAPVIDEHQAAAHRAALTTGEPRNGIVALWVELERAVAAAGTPPEASESPTEYVDRILRTHHVQHDALATLTSLYREARFSRHDMTEDHRGRAAEALDAVHSSLLSRSS